MSRTILSIAGLLAMAVGGSSLRADPPPSEPGYRTVAIKQGDKTAYIRVKDSPNPFSQLRDSGEKGPEHFSFNQTSPMANKTYDTGNAASSQDDGSYQRHLEHTFLTKSYFEGNPTKNTSLPDRPMVNSASGFTNRAFDANKSFMTAKADLGSAKFAEEANATSSESGRTAVLGGHEVKTFASSMSTKSYEGEEAKAVKHDLTQMNEGLVGMKDLPNRPLTIDEVRALINHGVKPETDEKPPEPSKALNDPDYMPDAAPAPFRTKPGDEHHLLDQNDVDMLPPPGMMAHGATPPENSEPLPH